MSKLDPTIKQRAEQLAAEFPGSMVAVFLADGTYLYASPSHSELMGYQPDELLGRSLREFVHSGDLAHALLGFMDAKLHGRSVELGVRLVHKSGHPVRVRASAQHFIIGKGGALLIGQATPVDDEPQNMA